MKRAVFAEKILPKKIVKSQLVDNAEILLSERVSSLALFFDAGNASFSGKGAYVVLDFGKEIAGSVRIMLRFASTKEVRFRITCGESLNEAMSAIGEKGASNDHAVRDGIVAVASMADSRLFQTGFRFVRIELLDDATAQIQNIFAENSYDKYGHELYIRTDDKLLNKILDTAKYTIKLCLQGGYIWDGVKRDRLVWAGDLHQEIVSSLYIWGDNENVPNSLDFMKMHPVNSWMNGIPSYSAWWVINLLSYVEITGNTEYFEKNFEYAEKVIKRISDSIKEDGTLKFEDGGTMEYFLDWPTCNTPDAYVGTAALVKMMAQRYLAVKENADCHNIIDKLNVDLGCTSKQVAAFKLLAGENTESTVFDKNGAQGFSTFMAYYILTAYFKAGGKDSIKLIKEYFGAMLSLGATTFWEDFDISWKDNATGIDEFSKQGKNDIHGDFGKFCYVGFRHSLCHGWSSGVLAFFIESILGIKVEGNTVTVLPVYSGKAHVKLPVGKNVVDIKLDGGNVEVKAPKNIKIIK
jgi:hypothetical protein